MGIIVVSAYKNTTINDQTSNLGSIDPQWRLLIGLGCIPGVVALYFRLTIPETPRFTMDIERNIERATADVKQVLDPSISTLDDDAVTRRVQVPKASWADFSRYFYQWKNLKILIGTSYSWFALDVSLRSFHRHQSRGY